MGGYCVTPREDGLPAVGFASALMVAVFTAGLWDVLVTYGFVIGPTVSEVLRAWVSRWPVAGVLLGVVLGHIFWP